MVSLAPDATIKGFAITQFLADVENSPASLPEVPATQGSSETTHAALTHIKEINRRFHDKLSNIVDEAGGSIRTTLGVKTVFDLYDVTVTNYRAQHSLSLSVKDLFDFLVQAHRETLVAAFAAEMITMRGEGAKQRYLQEEVKKHLKLLKHIATPKTPYYDRLAMAYLQIAKQLAEAPNGIPTFYADIAKAFMAGHLQELTAIAKQRLRELSAEESTRNLVANMDPERRVLDRLRKVAHHFGYDEHLVPTSTTLQR